MAVKPKRLLADLEQHLNILDKLPFALFQLNKRLKVVWANLEANELVGTNPVDAPVEELFASPLLVEALNAALDERTGMGLEFKWSRGVSRDLVAGVVPLTTKTTQGGWLVLTLRDVTKQRQADRTRVDFVANASHELRTPLSSLVGFIETLQGPAANDPQARERFLRIMQSETHRMSRLVEDLLSLSRIELNATSQPTQPVDLGSIMRTVQESLELKAQANDQVIELRLGGGPVVAKGDQDELTQVVRNLTENAIKYSAPNSRIVLQLKSNPKKGTASIAVKDQGEGIAPEHLGRLTERFYRVDKARSRDMGGTGLGLAITKHILNRHGGKLGIKSIVGKGSTFKATVPLWRDSTKNLIQSES